MFVSMGNLFRCPINSEEREYILKAGGIVQEGYEAILVKYYDTTYGDASVSSSRVWVRKNGHVRVCYEFDATKWNKLHVKKLYCYGRNSGYPMLGITKWYPSGTYDIEDDLVSKVFLSDGNSTDYILDISSLSGTQYFCIYAKSTTTNVNDTMEISVAGDIYLTE